MIRFTNTFFLGYIILWPLIFKFILPVDGAGRVYMLLAIIVLLLNMLNRNFRTVFSKPPVLIWGIWVIYTIFNWFISGYPPPENLPTISFLFVYLIMPWLAMYVAVYESIARPKLLLQSIHVFLFIYVLLGIVFQINTFGAGERGGEVLGNALPLISLCLTFVACLGYNMKLIKMSSLVSSVILSLLSVLMVATRKAFAGEIIILFFFILSNIKKLNFKSVFKIVIIVVFFCFCILFILNNTTLGDRFFNISDAAEKYNTSDSRLLSLLGDRAYFYISGWELFIESPMCGIGINNFMNVTDYPMPIHSEYMVQLAENGIIGFVLYVTFILSLFTCVRQIADSHLRRLSLGWILCVLFISFTAWVYDMSLFFIVFGLILGIQQQNNRYTRS